MFLSFSRCRWLRLTILIVLAAESAVKCEQEMVANDSVSPPQNLQGVVALTDETFEHQTQASTGQTTGSWLVWFYDDANDSVTGSFPSESEWLEDHIVVGAVNVAEGSGAKLKKRFAIEHLPVFLFFHKGKMYRYAPSTSTHYEFSWAAVRAFCQSPDSSLAESIQPPPSFFSEMWTGFQNSREYPFLVEAGTYYIKVMAGLGVFLVVGLSIKAISARMDGSSGRKAKSE
jgi:hypothetical protein